MGVTMTNSVRRWAAGVGLAGGAVVAAGMIGAASAPAAHADDGSLTTDIGLLNAAETNMQDAFSLAGWTDTEFPHLINQWEAIQTPLLSSDNSFVSGWGEFLFNGPDQQLAQSTDAFLSAGEAYAADPSATTGLAELSPFIQLIDTLFLDTLPSNVIGKLTDDVLGYQTSIAGAAADVATSASATPDEVIGQAISDLNQGAALLDAAPTADLSTKQLDLLTGQVELAAQLDPLLTQIGTAEDAISPGDQTFLAEANEQFVSAAQNVLSAEQAFVVADQAGQLSGSGFASADLPVLEADLGLVGADFSVLNDVILAAFDPNLDALIPTDLLTAVDPSSFTDLLSSIGF